MILVRFSTRGNQTSARGKSFFGLFIFTPGDNCSCHSGGFKNCLFWTLPGEMIQFDEYFSNGSVQPPTSGSPGFGWLKCVPFSWGAKSIQITQLAKTCFHGRFLVNMILVRFPPGKMGIIFFLLILLNTGWSLAAPHLPRKMDMINRSATDSNSWLKSSTSANFIPAEVWLLVFSRVPP